VKNAPKALPGPPHLQFQLEMQDEPVLARLKQYHEMVTGKRLSYLAVIRLTLKAYADYLKQFEPRY
jgi:hypothetical protein